MEEDRIDIGALATGLGVEEGRIRELYDLFLETANTDLEQLERAVTESDPEQAVSAAHSIKGAALGLGLSSLSQQALEVERRTRLGSMTGVGGLVEDLRRRLQEVASLVGR